MRELIRRVAAEKIAAGDRHLEIVEGTDLLGPTRGDGLVDGTHPNDLGFQWMAEGLVARIGKVLGGEVGRLHHRPASSTISISKFAPAPRVSTPIRSSLPWSRLSLSVRMKIGTPYTSMPFSRRKEPSVAPRTM